MSVLDWIVYAWAVVSVPYVVASVAVLYIWRFDDDGDGWKGQP